MPSMWSYCQLIRNWLLLVQDINDISESHCQWIRNSLLLVQDINAINVESLSINTQLPVAGAGDQSHQCGVTVNYYATPCCWCRTSMPSMRSYCQLIRNSLLLVQDINVISESHYQLIRNSLLLVQVINAINVESLSINTQLPVAGAGHQWHQWEQRWAKLLWNVTSYPLHYM